MYDRGPSSASKKHRSIKIDAIWPFSSVWASLKVSYFSMLWLIISLCFDDW